MTVTRPCFPTLPTRHPPITHSGADPPDPASVPFPTRPDLLSCRSSTRLILFVAVIRPTPTHLSTTIYHFAAAAATTTTTTTTTTPKLLHTPCRPTHTTHHRPPRPSSSVQPHRIASRPSIRSSTCLPFACGFFVFPRRCRIVAHNGIQGETVALPLVLPPSPLSHCAWPVGNAPRVSSRACLIVCRRRPWRTASPIRRLPFTMVALHRHAPHRTATLIANMSCLLVPERIQAGGGRRWWCR